MGKIEVFFYSLKQILCDANRIVTLDTKMDGQDACQKDI